MGQFATRNAEYCSILPKEEERERERGGGIKGKHRTKEVNGEKKGSKLR